MLLYIKAVQVTFGFTPQIDGISGFRPLKLIVLEISGVYFLRILGDPRNVIVVVIDICTWQCCIPKILSSLAM